MTERNLLLPSPYPLYPADLQTGEERVVTPLYPPWKPSPEEMKEFARNEYMPEFDRRYWRLRTDYGPVFPKETISAVWLNKPEQSAGVRYGSGCGLEALEGTPVIRMPKKPTKSGIPDYWEAYNFSRL